MSGLRPTGPARGRLRTMAAIPVTVVTGFLGAGKTTIVNRWLADVSRGEIAVVVNELGAVGIDGELLAERARTLVEIAGGCVCCTTQAELVAALQALAERDPQPLRVLVETSGAASPAGVVRAVASGGREGAFVLDGVVTVVDATRLGAVVAHDLAIEQIGYADVVLLSRADACGPGVLDEAREEMLTRNGAALVVASARGALVAPELPDLEALLALRRDALGEPRTLPARASGHAQPYESVSLVVEGELDDERFADFVEGELARIGGRLFRTKGILAMAGADVRVVVQGVAGEIEVTFGAPWAEAPRRSRLVLVGFGLDGDALARAFAACAVTGSREEPRT